MKIDLDKLEVAYQAKQLKRKSDAGASSSKNHEKKLDMGSGYAPCITERTKTLAIPQLEVDAFISLERKFLVEPPMVDQLPKPFCSSADVQSWLTMSTSSIVS